MMLVCTENRVEAINIHRKNKNISHDRTLACVRTQARKHACTHAPENRVEAINFHRNFSLIVFVMYTRTTARVRAHGHAQARKHARTENRVEAINFHKRKLFT